MKPIVIVPTSASKAEIEKIESEGWLVIRCNQPEKIKLVLPTQEISGSDFLMAAMHGVTSGSYSNMCDFTKELFRRMTKNEQPSTATQPCPPPTVAATNP